MEVVVSLSESNQSGDYMVTGRVAVIKWLVTKPMSQRIDTESRLLHKEDSKDAGVNESTNPITPTQARNEARKDQSHGHNDPQIVFVLPNNDGVFVQIGNICPSNAFRILLQDHPSQVRIHQSFADTVRVFFRIRIAMMSSVIARPPTDGSFNSTTSNGGKKHLKRKSGRIRSVGPQTVISFRDVSNSGSNFALSRNTQHIPAVIPSPVQ